jgi:hypothetical protein
MENSQDINNIDQRLGKLEKLHAYGFLAIGLVFTYLIIKNLEKNVA